MHLTVNQHPLYCYTGGKAFDPAKPSVVFIHGVLNDHSVWILQSRYLANHGYNVLAIDLPGHGKSAGPCPRSVESAAQTVLDFLDAAGIHRAALIGHSWGSLIALHAASLAPERVTHLALICTASPMKVSSALLDSALNNPQAAINMVNQFSHSSLAPPPSNLGPGTWLYGGSRALMRRVLASNSKENIFHLGFTACDQYLEANTAAALINNAQAAILFIVGALDQMTPPKAAQPLIQAAPRAKVVTLQGGHSLMSEAPDTTLFALRDFLGESNILVEVPAKAASI